jgi:NTP pyrophosphatase (non-canonical NTP hydrolase)
MKEVMQNFVYQSEVVRTMGQLTGKEALCNWALGLAGETGEIIEHVKKHVFHGRTLDKEYLEKEIGDALWYLTAMVNDLDLRLDKVMAANIAKLRERYPDGFKRADD